jgi:hypothetical protein
MFSRDSSKADDPKFVHQVAAGIIARAHAKLKVASGSNKADRDREEAAKSAANFCSKLETLSSLLQTPITSSVDPDLKPVIERVQLRIAKSNKSLASQSAGESSVQQGRHKATLKNSETSSLNETELKRLAMSEMTKIPVKVLEKRLPGLGVRLMRHLSPERPKSSFDGDCATSSELTRATSSSTAAVALHCNEHWNRRNESFKHRNSIACTVSNVDNKNWAGGGIATCAAAILAIVFCSRMKNVHLPAYAFRSQAAIAIQRAYLRHFCRIFYGSRRKRAAFFILVKRLRILVRNWRLRKRTRVIHFVKRFLISIKLRSKFVRAVKQKWNMVRPFLRPILQTLIARSTFLFSLVTIMWTIAHVIIVIAF